MIEKGSKPQKGKKSEKKQRIFLVFMFFYKIILSFSPLIFYIFLIYFFDHIRSFFESINDKLAFGGSLFGVSFLMFEIYRVMVMKETRKLFFDKKESDFFLKCFFIIALFFSVLAFSFFSFVIFSIVNASETLSFIFVLIFMIPFLLIVTIFIESLTGTSL